MDELLPSYENATQQNPWQLIAPYLQSAELRSSALVCQLWHRIFSPQLWGDPASHFGLRDDTVYVALTRFKRTLVWARLWVRELTHTLHLPPAHAELYGGPHYEWLRDCLELLPHLQCLKVDGLPFFDHAALLTLKHPSMRWQQIHASVFSTFPLRLLDASGCGNATCNGLAEALPHFPDLVSLNLSRTLAARDEVVLKKLEYLPNLRILHLEGLRLKDADLSLVCAAIGTRVRSVNLRDNHLTDVSARSLVEYCLRESRHGVRRTRSPASPVGDCRPPNELGDFANEHLENHLRSALQSGFNGSLAIEEARNAGITHLYIDKNDLTAEGISGLLRTGHLQVLDIGTPAQILTVPHQHTPDHEPKQVSLPGAEKLTPVIAQFAAERLVYLRIGHAVICQDHAAAQTDSLPVELGSSLDQVSGSRSFELSIPETANIGCEIDGAAVVELAGDSLQLVELPPTVPGITSSSDVTTQPSETIHVPPTASWGLSDKFIVAVEDVEPTGPPNMSTRNTCDATGGLSPFIATPEDKEVVWTPRGPSTPLELKARQPSAFRIRDRRAMLDLRQSQEPRLHPHMVSKVRTLVLCDVPGTTHDRVLIDRLIQFISDCGVESDIAKHRAQHTYRLPPGRNRAIAELEYAQSLFALRRIVLEIAEPTREPRKTSASWRMYPTKSSTEDADSEAFWKAANQDFSFFNDEECGLPDKESDHGLPLVATNGLMLASENHAILSPTVPDRKVNVRPSLDVVAEIARFRKERKEAFLAASLAGVDEAFVDGYWPGIITVVRQPCNTDHDKTDYYGNRYQSGWLYR